MDVYNVNWTHCKIKQEWEKQQPGLVKVEVGKDHQEITKEILKNEISNITITDASVQ